MTYNLTDIISKKLDDLLKTDFTPIEYEQSILVAKRSVGRTHSVLRRYFKKQIIVSELQDLDISATKNKAIKLEIPSFMNDYMVFINKKKLDRKLESEELTDNTYQIYPSFDGVYFNYYPRGNNDLLECYYEANIEIDDFDDPITEPILPSMYDEELISAAIIYLCEIGIARFAENDIKHKKYVFLLSRYDKKIKRNELDNNRKDIVEWPTLQIPKYL